MGSRHPWEITLREFVEEVRRDYGIEIDATQIVDGIVFARQGDHYYATRRRGGPRSWAVPEAGRLGAPEFARPRLGSRPARTSPNTVEGQV